MIAADPVYIGCYKDCDGGRSCTQSNRDLPTYYCANGKDDAGGCGPDPNVPCFGVFAGGRDMTPQLCSGICSGFKFFGIQAGYQCYCGNDYGNQGGKAPARDCPNKCTGNTTLSCGGGSRNSIYANPGW